MATAKVKIPKGWRKLKPSEIIKAGDKFRRGDKWQKTTNPGLNAGYGTLLLAPLTYIRRLSIAAVVERMRGVVIEQKDAQILIAQHDSAETLFYVDPPYLPETRDDTRADYRHELTPSDHVSLAEVLKKVRGKVILSGYASPAYEDLYRGWHRAESPALADGGRARTEVLWMNYAPSQSRPDLFDKPKSSPGAGQEGETP